MVSPTGSAARGGGSSRTPSRSPAKTGSDDLASGLSAKLGDLLLTEKEATGLIIKDLRSEGAPRPRWALVGKVCSSRKLIIAALEKAMDRAWGLHGPAQFKDLGDNRFVVRFSREGDWKHVKENGPWQFDFNAVLLKDYDGSVRPSDMIFDSLEVWARVSDLPLDMMNKVYGKRIGGWIGEYIATDVDEDGMAWGDELRIRVAVKVDQPLMRGVSMRESEDDVEGMWFDIKYEKIPHFCFDCGCLIHPEGKCLAERDEVKQWGEWLRAEPRKNRRKPSASRPSASSGSFTSRSFSTDSWSRDPEISVRDIPVRRNPARVFSNSSSSRTGGDEHRRFRGEVNSPNKGHWAGASAYREDFEESRQPTRAASPPRKNQLRSGTFTRRTRNVDGAAAAPQVPLGMTNRKRGTKQVWLPVEVRVVGDASNQGGKRQRTSSVFDRLEDPTNPSADLAGRGRRDQ
jgi:hypothetical protein